MEPGWPWAALVLLFAASLLTVSAWLLQLARGLLRRLRPAARALLRKGEPGPGAGAGGGAAQHGPRALLAALGALRPLRLAALRAWTHALHAAQQHGKGSSIQISFEESPQQLPAVTVTQLTCTDRSDRSMTFRCGLSTDSVQFPVSVTQQSPAAVSMDTYQVTLAVLRAQLEIRLEEIQDEGLLVSWAFRDRPDLDLSVAPRLQLRDDNDGRVDPSTIKELIEDSVISTQPAMMVNLKACLTGGNLPPCSKLSPGPRSGPAPKLLLHRIRGLRLGSDDVPGSRELCCAVELDSPRQQKRTRPAPSSPAAEVEWPDKLVLDLGPRSKELKLSILASSSSSNRNGPGEEVLLGFAAVPLSGPSKDPRDPHHHPHHHLQQQVFPLRPGPRQRLPPDAAVALQLLYQEAPDPSAFLRASITPTKKVETDRTIMPDGTIVTTVTTIQSRPKVDGKLDSPSRSPSKVEVTEKVTTMLPQDGGLASASPTSSRGSRVSNGLDPVAETAIRQLTDLTNKPVKKTPTKRSTLIISGVSKVPLAEDEMALSLGYAASLEGALQEDSLLAGVSEFSQSLADTPAGASYAAQGASQELDEEATRSDASGDEAESETGSTGALETRSLKDHKVSFLRSGTKLIFRRKRKQKEAGLSQSHDDLPNLAANAAPRKASGSFSRRLIKRFSFKARPKAKANGSATAAAADKH